MDYSLGYPSTRGARIGLGILAVVALAVPASAVSITPARAASFDPNAAAQQLVNDINLARAQSGLPALVNNRALGDIAQGAPISVCPGQIVHGRSQDMIERGYFSHQIPACGQYVWPALQTAGVPFTSGAENIGWNNYPPDQSVDQLNASFLTSAPHLANIMGNFNQVGVGAWMAPGSWNGYWGVIMYTEIFASAALPSGGTCLYATMLNGTSSGQVEIHALTEASHYTQFILQSTSAFRTPTPDWHFYIASFQGDGQPDLIGIKERNTGSGFVEVHVLSAASGYRSFLLHAATPLRPAVVANSLQFAVGSFDGDQRPNLYAILPTNTGSGTVEVHVLSEATNYSVWALHSASALSAAPSTVPNWQFRIGDRYGRGDLVGINHGATGSGHTEVHILSRNSGYQTFSLHAATPMGYTSDSQFAFVLGDHDNDGLPDLYALMMNGSGTGQTEAHILSGASGFTNWIEHTPTGLGPTNSADWQFSTYR
jgi:uncharacterized protein YkwD